MRVYEVYNAKGIGELTVYVIKSGKIASYRKWRWRLKLNVDEESKFELLDPFLDSQRVCLALFTRRDTSRVLQAPNELLLRCFKTSRARQEVSFWEIHRHT